MRENRTYGSEGGEVLTHLSDPIKQQRRRAPLWEAACGRRVLAQSETSIARKRAPTNSEGIACSCGRPLAGD